MMRFLTSLFPLLALITATAGEPMRTSFTIREDLGVSIALLTPAKDSSILRHTYEDGIDTVVASIADDRDGGLMVEIRDHANKSLWKHDYGYNLSAQPGCKIAVAIHPSLPILLIHYHGYKWDHEHTLLFLDSRPGPLQVRPYATQDQDVLPALKASKNYSADFNYLIQAQSLTKDGVIFECIPIEKPEVQSVHPFHQDHSRWFRVTTAINARFQITPTEVRSLE